MATWNAISLVNEKQKRTQNLDAKAQANSLRLHVLLRYEGHLLWNYMKGLDATNIEAVTFHCTNNSWRKKLSLTEWVTNCRLKQPVTRVCKKTLLHFKRSRAKKIGTDCFKACCNGDDRNPESSSLQHESETGKKTNILCQLTCTVSNCLQSGIRPQGVEIIFYFICTETQRRKKKGVWGRGRKKGGVGGWVPQCTIQTSKHWQWGL